MSERVIRIDHPGDGEWIMRRVGGMYNDRTDHTVALHRDGAIAGGVVFTGFLRASMLLHMAGSEDNWATPDFLWMVFDYVFNQQGCRTALGLVASANLRALEVDLKLGFRIVAIVHDVLEDDDDMLVMAMRREHCRWLRLTPRKYRSNKIQWVH
jgi:hypothetical protein